VEDGVHTSQLLDVLLKRAQVQTLLDDGPSGAGLEVKHVLHVLDQRSYAGVEVRALGVRHGLKTEGPKKVTRGG
jgi:hypothetical protein